MPWAVSRTRCVATSRRRGPSNRGRPSRSQAGFFFDCQAVVALRLLRMPAVATGTSSGRTGWWRRGNRRSSTQMDAISAFQHSGRRRAAWRGDTAERSQATGAASRYCRRGAAPAKGRDAATTGSRESVLASLGLTARRGCVLLDHAEQVCGERQARADRDPPSRAIVAILRGVTRIGRFNLLTGLSCRSGTGGRDIQLISVYVLYVITRRNAQEAFGGWRNLAVLVSN
jgi:hypothetical protein